MLYTCTACGKQGAKRVDGSCPNCWTPVYSYKTKDGQHLWVPEGNDTPPVQLVKFWLGELSERISGEQGYRVVRDIHPVRQKHKYQAEIAMASNLLMIAEWDLELAKLALGRVVHNAYKAPTTLAWVSDDYDAMLDIERGARAQNKRKTSQDYTRELLESMEDDVWD